MSLFVTKPLECKRYLSPTGNSTEHPLHMSRIMRKPAFCMCEKKGADQLHGNHAADQHLFFATQIVQSLYFLHL